MAWTWRSGTRQEFRLSCQITESLRDFRYKFPLSPRHWGALWKEVEIQDEHVSICGN